MRPVRSPERVRTLWHPATRPPVGNGAWNQRQIDVYGELLGSAHRLVEQLNPDHPGRRLCWVALDRAVAMADTLRAADRVEGWRAAAGEIRDEIQPDDPEAEQTG